MINAIIYFVTVKLVAFPHYGIYNRMLVLSKREGPLHLHYNIERKLHFIANNHRK